MAQARIVTQVQDIYTAADLAHAGFDIAGPRWKDRARRMASAQRTVADHWLLEEDGHAVSSLLCYPLIFGLPDGSVALGFGLGAVTTHAAKRRRGHASQLCRTVAEHAAQQGRNVGLLFSGIPPQTYERLGYRCCAAADPVTAKLAKLASSGAQAELNPIDPRRSVPMLSGLHAEHHRGMLHMHRDAAAWQHSFERGAEDWWFTIGPQSRPRGYVRWSVDRHVLDIIELVLSDKADEAPVLRALAALGVELELKKMGAWIPMSSFVESWFTCAGRESAQPMVLGVDAGGASQFWASDHF